MSKNITVSEGNTARVFGNTKKLETKLQGEDAGTCFWVPEDETDAQPLYITENGLYEASEAGVYGFSEAHVNISKKVTDDDGTDWNIHIDDEGIPHITVDDPDDPYTGTDISIDDGTGDIDVYIPGNDPDDWPEWDDLDPDVKIDFDDWMDDPKIPGDWPGWDDMAPEIVDEFDGWMDDPKDPDDWPGWDDLDPDEKTDFDDWLDDYKDPEDWPGWDDLAPEIVDEFDGWMDDPKDPDDWPGWDDLDPDEKTDFDDWMDDPKDPDDWPGWEDIDPEIKTDFDDWTADSDTEIDPDEAGLDPEKDIDVSFDPDEHDVDMVGMDGNWDESVVSYDPRTGDYEKDTCPVSIEIVELPTKTTFIDGDVIDFSGLVVRALDKNGNAWEHEHYPDGIIPFSELVFHATVADASKVSDETSEATSDWVDIPIPMGNSFYSLDYLTEGIAETDFSYSGGSIAQKKSGGWIVTICASPDSGQSMTTNQHRFWKEVYPKYRDTITDPEISNQDFYNSMTQTATHDSKTVYYCVTSGAYGGVQNPPPEVPVDFDGRVAWTLVYGTITTHGGTQKIPIGWNSPCFKELETNLEITVTDFGGATGGGGQTSGGGAGRN